MVCCGECKLSMPKEWRTIRLPAYLVKFLKKKIVPIREENFENPAVSSLVSEAILNSKYFQENKSTPSLFVLAKMDEMRFWLKNQDAAKYASDYLVEMRIQGDAQIYCSYHDLESNIGTCPHIKYAISNKDIVTFFKDHFYEKVKPSLPYPQKSVTKIQKTETTVKSKIYTYLKLKTENECKHYDKTVDDVIADLVLGYYS